MKKLKEIILFVFLLFMAGCSDSELLSGLSQNEANEAMFLLERIDIKTTKKANKKKTAYSLIIKSDDFSRAVQILKEYGYPKKQETNLKDLFKKEGLVSSPLEDKVRYIYGLELGIQDTLNQIDGVITSKAHIVIPDNDPFKEKTEPSSASVFIKHRPDSDISQFKPRIKRLVEKSIAGLSYDQVSLVLIPATPLKNSSLNDSLSPNENSLFYLFTIIILMVLLFSSWLFFFYKDKLIPIKVKLLEKMPLLIQNTIKDKETSSPNK